jgi:hypothetical protein
MINGSSNINLAERIESVKAGILAAAALGIAYGIITLSNSLILAEQFEELAELQINTVNLHLWVSSAIALLGGFLFGVTYRYVIREDSNPHLKSGAVLAFGLVRGLAQVDIGLHVPGAIWPFVVLGLESVVLFAIARLVLDGAIDQGWVKPFNSR